MIALDRITSSQDILHGKARICGQRITVENIVGQIACGYSIDQVLEAYPTLVREDITQALRYAAELASQYILQIAA